LAGVDAADLFTLCKKPVSACGMVDRTVGPSGIDRLGIGCIDDGIRMNSGNIISNNMKRHFAAPLQNDFVAFFHYSIFRDVFFCNNDIRNPIVLQSLHVDAVCGLRDRIHGYESNSESALSSCIKLYRKLPAAVRPKFSRKFRAAILR
jgi:hypothetical protein